MGEISTGNKIGILIFLFGVGFVILLFLIGTEINFRFNTPPPVVAGSEAPDFSYPDLEGKTVSLSDYRGKLVLVNIWATWCKPCVDEMPSMEKLYDNFKDKEFEILAVSIDKLGEKAVRPFMEFHKLNFKALLDTRGEIQQVYRVTGIPESFIIDRDGVIIEKVIGSFDWSSPKAFKFFEKQLEKSSI
jgi:cytochrome c biogenesis protein CcmG/thiol:disulfide interchange protein DsbE